MPNQDDVSRYLGSDINRAFDDAFISKFKGVGAAEHAETLRKLIDAEKRVQDLQDELDDVKAHYDRKLKELRAP